MKTDIDKVPTIKEYFKNQSVFITGASGFVGKVLVEKLLRSCSDIKCLYLLIREKRGASLEERFNEIINKPLFNRLKEEHSCTLENKVILVNGDVTQVNLGLSKTDRKMLEDNVSIVFHVAASVRFDDPLREAIITNVRGTREVMMLARNMKHLQALLHVSTTYCNTDKKELLEKVYEPHADWSKTIELAERYDNDKLKILTAKYMDGMPNTYTFTKALAEQVINDLGNNNLPVIIFRPSIVIATLWEPIKGWIDNFNGPVGIFVASGKGIMRIIYSDPNLVADYIPVDITVKAMITAVWQKGLEKTSVRNQLLVYNCSSNTVKKITMGDLVKLGFRITAQIPLENILWTPRGTMTKSKIWFYLNVLMFHLLPALLIDIVLKSMGHKLRLLKLQRRIYIANMALQYFITNQWLFHNENFLRLENLILKEDKTDWSFDFAKEDVVDYFRHCLIGGKKFLLKEEMSNLPQAVTHAKRMYWLDKLVRIIFWIIVITVFIKSSYTRKIRNIFQL